MAPKPDSKTPTPEAQLRSFINGLDSKTQKLFRSVRTAVRKRFPTANELAYAYSHSVVVSYSPTDRGIDGIVSIATRADGVRLYFNQGPRLPDPKQLLLGSGKETRFIHVEAASQLIHPDVQSLIVAAIARATVPLPSTGKGQLIIRGAAAKQRPRTEST